MLKSSSALPLFLMLGWLLAACSSSGEGDEPTVPPSGDPSTPALSNEPVATPSFDSLPPSGAGLEFSTDFSVHSVDYDEILSGGPPKDGIPSIDNPRFLSTAEAGDWLEPQEPVLSVEIGGDARAYPLRVLTWHEIANDVVGEEPILVTFCPLCNTGIAFERTVEGQVLDFGTTGRLRYSNLIMYDRQTESWWQQATGEAIVGELTGTALRFLPAPIISAAEFIESFPDGLVLSDETGFNRPYGQNPYVGYDDVESSPFLYQGPSTSNRLPAMARVLAVDLNGETIAFPFDTLAEERVVHTSVGGQDIVVFWAEGTASALDQAQIASGRDVGASNAFSPVLEGLELMFVADEHAFVDEATGTRWDLSGRAIEGELAGEQLTPVVAVNHFWFSWVAFKPQTKVYAP